MTQPGTPDEFIAFLGEPAEPDPADELTAWSRFMVCPGCAASYPAFHSPEGSMHTLCDDCGWSSEEPGTLIPGGG